MAHRNIVCILTAGTFQYISAVEAVANFTNDSDTISLYASARAQTCTELMNLPWDRTAYLPHSTNRSRLDLYRGLRQFTRGARRFIIESGEPDILLLGNLGDPFNAIAHQCNPERIVVLDEGTGTPAAYRKRLTNLTPQDNALRHRVEGKVKKLIYTGSTAALTKVNAFTVFHHLPLTSADEITLHGFDSLKTTRTGRLSSYTLVLGTPAVQRGMIDIYEYRKMMARINAQAAHSIVAYRPHPDEQDNVRSYVPSEWRIERSTEPIESELLRNDVPKQIVGWASSALISAKLLVGDLVAISQVRPADGVISQPWARRMLDNSKLVTSFGIDDLNDST